MSMEFNEIEFGSEAAADYVFVEGRNLVTAVAGEGRPVGWWKHYTDNAQTGGGQNFPTITSNPSIKWRTTPGSGNPKFKRNIRVFDGNVYAVTWDNYGTSWVGCLDAADGSVVWEHDQAGYPMAGAAAPQVVYNGTFMYGQGQNLIGFDASDGTEKYHIDPGVSMNDTRNHFAMDFENGRVFVIPYAENPQVMAFDVATGEKTVDTTANLGSGAGHWGWVGGTKHPTEPVVYGSTFTAYGAIDYEADEVLWYGLGGDTSGDKYGNASVAYYDGHIYGTHWLYQVFKADPMTGDIIWEWPAGGSDATYYPEPTAAIAIYNDTIYYMDQNQEALGALDLDGNRLWTKSHSMGSLGEDMFLPTDGVVVGARYDHMTGAWDASDGSELWSLDLSGGNGNSDVSIAAADLDGNLYYGEYSGYNESVGSIVCVEGSQ